MPFVTNIAEQAAYEGFTEFATEIGVIVVFKKPGLNSYISFWWFTDDTAVKHYSPDTQSIEADWLDYMAQTGRVATAIPDWVYQVKHRLNIQPPTGNGNTTPSTGSYDLVEGTTNFEVIATPADGWVFGWWVVQGRENDHGNTDPRFLWGSSYDTTLKAVFINPNAPSKPFPWWLLLLGGAAYIQSQEK